MTSDKLRSEFLSFFKKKKHKIVPSDSLVPINDPTLLFTGAGMNQFKDQFLGKNITYTRAVTCQKCLRTADLEKVGKTAGHHTFFEMLGNFSFGDYFKKEAILWAWEFLTAHLKLPKERLWASVYVDDEEASSLWKDLVKLPEEKIIKLGDKENFWPSQAKTKGPNGPCGPCSEIFYDWGAKTGCKKSSCNPSCECGRFVEVWNLVFTQFNRSSDSSLKELPRKNIDTGMGLERLSAIVERVKTNFEITLFKPLIEAVTGRIKYTYGQDSGKDAHVNAISDHARAITFAIADGARPSNENRGFVIRKLIRKSAQRGRIIGIHEPFLYKLTEVVMKTAKAAYPELAKQKKDISSLVLQEEGFLQNMLDTVLPNMENDFLEAGKTSGTVVPGELIFKYYDEKGIPLDLMEEAALSRRLKLDMKKFNKLLENQKTRSREKSKVGDSIFVEKFLADKKTVFLKDKSSIEAKILAVSEEADFIHIALDKTVFYGRSGGQVGDTGVVENQNLKINIQDAVMYEGTIDHIGKIVKGEPKKGKQVKVSIDLARRKLIAKNHTATHLLHAALKKVLGKHANQFGSLVAPDRLRFDFTHPSKLSETELKKVEDMVNEFIKKGYKSEAKSMPLEAAKKEGAIALFGEKYGEEVTVRSIAGISKELCGGTHVKNTSEIGIFKIIRESSIASGVRRIEAVTGEAVYEWMKKDKLMRAMSDLKKEEKSIQKKQKREAFETHKLQIDAILKEAKQIQGISVISKEISSLDTNQLRSLLDLIKQRLKSGVIMLASVKEDRVSIILGVTKDLVSKGINAGQLIKKVAISVGGSGGGRPDLAQAGGKDPSRIGEALKSVYNIIQEEVSK